MSGQISTVLADGAQVISAARLVEDGYRAALVHLPGVFRLDVAPLGDTLRTVIRNLSNGPLVDTGRTDGYVLSEDVDAELVPFSPSRVDISFTIDGGDALIDVRGTIGILWRAPEHAAQFTAQLVVRTSPCA